MAFRAVLLDLYGTIGCAKGPMTSEEISNFLLTHGYEVYPQSLDAASHYVSMIDYPKHCYATWRTYLNQVLHRLDVKMDSETLKELVKLYEKHRSIALFQDVAPAVRAMKKLNLKTATVTTIAHFCSSSAIAPIREYFDLVMTAMTLGVRSLIPRCTS